ncbi:MAG: DUF4342 domain-containing protein [Chloroflexi bacterium]|nr:DUF4342 domain-containing protein [Chloroflexota bacterium]
MTDNHDENGEPKEPRTIIEEIELEGRQLVDRVKEILHEGNIRKLSIKDANGRYLLEIPLTVGVVAGGVFALASPVAAALGALAALVADVKLEVTRIAENDDDDDDDDDD